MRWEKTVERENLDNIVCLENTTGHGSFFGQFLGLGTVYLQQPPEVIQSLQLPAVCHQFGACSTKLDQNNYGKTKQEIPAGRQLDSLELVSDGSGKKNDIKQEINCGVGELKCTFKTKGCYHHPLGLEILLNIHSIFPNWHLSIICSSFLSLLVVPSVAPSHAKPLNLLYKTFEFYIKYFHNFTQH